MPASHYKAPSFLTRSQIAAQGSMGGGDYHLNFPAGKQTSFLKAEKEFANFVKYSTKKSLIMKLGSMQRKKMGGVGRGLYD